MDLKETRAIPMWLAHPALPVGVGAFLFIALLLVEGVTRYQDAQEPTVATAPAKDLGPTKVAGHLRTGPPPVRAGKAVKEAKEASNRLAQSGDYLGAAKVYLDLPEEVRSSAAFKGDIDARVTLFLSRGGERLLFDVGKNKLSPEEAVERLEAFLAVEAAAKLPVAERVRAKLAELKG